MKRFSIACVLVLLLNVLCPVAGHVHAEEISTPTDQDTTCEHTAGHSCLGVCNLCGEAYTGGTETHNFDRENDDLQSDEDYHWYICKDCLQPMNKIAHFGATCESSTCSACGTAYDAGEINHTYTYEGSHGHDTDYHWYLCDECGEVALKEKHWAWCEGESLCDRCPDADDVTVNSVRHDFVDAEHNTETHTTLCNICQQEISTLTTTTTTEASCEEAGASVTTCSVCGTISEDVIPAIGYHSYGDYQHDDTYHWMECDLCGDVANYFAHYDTCQVADVCGTCGATDVTFKSTTCDNIDFDTYYFDEDYHWVQCIDCEKQWNVESHIAPCDGDGTCTTCGVECDVTHGNIVTKFDGTYHWNECETCGEPFTNKTKHIVYCDMMDQNVCGICGATAETYELGHTMGGEMAYDENSHWFTCACGELVESVDEHEVYCDNPDGSCYCGYTGEVSEIIHVMTEDTTFEWDEYTHWWTCACGEEHEESHFKGCTDDACWVCGYTGEILSTDGVYHNYSDTLEYDEKYHWFVCEDCGEPEEYLGGHWAYCNSNICESCGAEFDNSDPNHEWPDTYEYDASGHWYTCNLCGEEIAGEHWYSCDSPKTCLTCGYVTTGATNYYHWWTDSWETDNPDYHYKKCPECGEAHSFYAHSVSCANPGVCTAYGCGATNVSVDSVSHGDVTWQHDDTKHWGVCNTCGETIEEGLHWTDCSNPTTCSSCGAENVTIADENLGHYDVDWTYYETDGTHHWYTCRTCNVKAFYAEHYTNCSKETGCSACGVAGDFAIKHEVLKAGYESDADNHWKVCAVCGEVANKEAHTDENSDNKCDTCGEAYTAPECEHSWKETSRAAATCTTAGVIKYTCELCQGTKEEAIAATGVHAWGEPVTVAATCTTAGSKTTACTTCEAKTVETIDATGHTWGEPVTVEATCAADGSKTTTCTVCGETTVEAIEATGHTWGEPVIVEATCAADGSKTTTCTVCGEATVETIPAHDNHTWETVSSQAATCTKQGRVEKICTVCDEVSIVTPAAKGHAYGLVFTSQGNGTHAKTCADCGAKYAVDCILHSTEMGNMTCSACATCGYTVYTVNGAVLETTENVDNADELADAKADTTVKLVQNVSFEVVAAPVEEGAETTDEAAETVDYSDVVLVVHETAVEMKAELPDTVNAVVKKVLAVSMLKEGAPIQPTSKVKLSIPVVEEEITGLKLVLMNENGELIEIEYEIIDGVLVFETDMVGVFLFVEAENAEA